MSKKNLFLIALLLTLALSACNLPSAQKTSSADATITALAAIIEAQKLPTNAAAPATNTPLPSDTPTVQFTLTAMPTSTVTLTPTITLTPTPSVPMVTVSQTTNCRTGPGTVYDLLGSLSPGQTAQVVGKYSAGNYWIIDTPGGSGTCWLWGQYAAVSGNTSGLPEMYPPPSPTPSLPAAPKHFGANKTCTSSGVFTYNVHVDLSWTDMATNEEGYYLYRNGKLLQTLAANSTSASDDTTLNILHVIGSPVPHIDYKLQAFNSAGMSDARELSVTCP
jgi:hypothetical protein